MADPIKGNRERELISTRLQGYSAAQAYIDMEQCRALRSQNAMDSYSQFLELWEFGMINSQLDKTTDILADILAQTRNLSRIAAAEREKARFKP